MTDENSRFDKVDERARAIIAITLLEHASVMLTQASNEAPRSEHINVQVALLNRKIRELQAPLLIIADGKCAHDWSAPRKGRLECTKGCGATRSPDDETGYI